MLLVSSHVSLEESLIGMKNWDLGEGPNSE